MLVQGMFLLILYFNSNYHGHLRILAELTAYMDFSTLYPQETLSCRKSKAHTICHLELRLFWIFLHGLSAFSLWNIKSLEEILNFIRRYADTFIQNHTLDEGALFGLFSW